MSKSRVHSSKPKIEEVRCQELIALAKIELQQWTTLLKRSIKSQTKEIDSNLVYLSEKQLIETYLQLIAEFMNIDRFDGDSPYNQTPELTVKSQKTAKAILLSSNLLSINKERDLVISVALDIFQSIRELQLQSLKKIMVFLVIYSKGFIPLNNGSEISLTQIGRSSFGELRYFSSDMEDNILAIYSVGYQQIPIFSPNNKEIDHFQLKFCIQLEEIVMLEELEYQEFKIKETIDKIEADKNYQSRYSYCFKDWSVNEAKKKNNVQYFSWKNINMDSKKVRKVEAVPFTNKKCTKYESLESFFKKEQECFYKNIASKLQLKSKSQNTKAQFTEQSSISYSRARDYVDFISKIPNFKFKLTKQQREVLEKDGNLIVIGRSGTGKTLLSILRLYAIEFLSKSSIVYREMREGRFTKTCIHHYVNKCFIEKNVFLTASSYLIEEIMKQYRDMHYQLQKEHKKSCEECKKLLHIGLELQSDTIDLEAVLDRIERRENICSSVSELKKEYFPEFFTVKSLISIIDCGLQRPFFNLKATRELKDRERKVINIYWENLYRIYEPYEDHLQMIFKNRLKHYPNLQINQTKGQDKTLVAVEIDYKIFSQSIWKEISSKYFKSIKKQRSKLNASVVWAEIFSIIKGSVKAHTTHLKCLSPAMYLEESKGLFLNEEEKMDIYYLFQEYQIYKIYNKCYDMMDVVNHILQQLAFGRYCDERLDYMFIDQVQDLTPATIYLLTKLTKKDVFYCGDTAQAISKGVTFKFSQIRSLYSKKYFKDCIDKEITEKEQHLSVNFRSHNRILMLANTVVAMIRELFPNSIDIMAPEKSDLFGPKPILIDNGDERLMYDLLLSPSQISVIDLKAAREKIKIEVLHKIPQKKQLIEEQENDEDNEESIDGSEDIQDEEEESFLEKAAELMNRKLSSQQVILVRNIKQKNSLPCYLKKQIQLTCEEVKGLQYQDVVIYNFFSSSPCKQKWALLDNLEITCRYVEPKQFQASLSRRSIEEGLSEKAPQLDLETMISLGYDTEKKMYKVLDLARNSNYAKIDIKQFHQISSELKIFYTLITRAKNTVIIFDRKVPRQLARLFNNLDIVKPILQEQLAEKQRQIKDYKRREGQDRYLNKANLWNEEAIKLLVRENFDQAIKCFERADNMKGVKRVQAMKIEKETNYELFRVQAQFQNPDKLSRQEFKMKKLKLAKHQNQLYEKLRNAGELYEEINLLQKAGQIFLKTKHYERAIKCFELTNNYEELAESYFRLCDYRRAIFYFQKCQNTSRIIDCYTKLEEWPKVFSLMIQNKDELKKQITEKESSKFKQDIQICLKEMLDSILSTPSIKDEQKFNKSFSNTGTIGRQQKERREFMESRGKGMENRLSQINTEYDIFTMKMICEKLSQKEQEYRSLSKQIQLLSNRHKLIQEQEEKIIKHIKEFDKEISDITKIIKKNKKLSTKELEEEKSHEEQKILLSQQSRKKQLMRELNQELQKVSEKLLEVEQELNRLQEIWEAKQLIYNHESLKIDHQVLVAFLEVLQKKALDQKSHINQIREEAFNQKYSENRNKVYKIWLGDHSIEAVLKETKDIIAVATQFVQPQDLKKHSFFHHRGVRTSIEAAMARKTDELSEAVRMFNFLDYLNCSSLRYIFCDYYGFKQHVHQLILEDTLRYSRNFFTKRKVKEVLNVLTNEAENDEIYNQNENKLDRLGDSSFKAIVTKYATKQCSYDEPLIVEVIQGLILQGFYENCLRFCNQSERYNLAHIFMDYDVLLSENLQKAKDTRRQNMKEQMKYYFFKTQKVSKKSVVDPQIIHLTLINIFSIQKIFFDFDQCEERPTLSKPIEIDEIELTDQQLQQCEKEAEKMFVEKHSEASKCKRDISDLEQLKQRITKNYNAHIQHCIIQSREKKNQLYGLDQQMEKIKDRLQQAIWDKNQIIEIFDSKNRQLRTAQVEKKKKQKLVIKMRRQFQDLKIEGGLTLGERQFKQKLTIMKANLEKVEEEFNRVLEEQGKAAYDFQIQEKKLKIMNSKVQKYTYQQKINYQAKKKLKSEIGDLKQEQKIQEQQKKVKLSELEREINQKKEIIKKWALKINPEEQERQINRIVIDKKKRANVNQINQLKRQEILDNIKKCSNLKDIKELKLLHHLIKKEIDIHFLTSKLENADLLLNVFNSVCEIEKGTLQSHQICLIIVVYLYFLFNGEFRSTCIQFCLHLKAQTSTRYVQLQQLKIMTSSLESQMRYNSKWLETINQKMRSPQNMSNPAQMKRLNQQKMGYISNIQNITNQYNFLQQRAEQSGLNLLSSDPMTHLHNLLSVYSKIKNVTHSTQNFMEILLGFFQCRIIKNCDILSFLEGEYVLMQADSIILKKMIEQNLLSFGYYFDCHNRIVLTTFKSVHQTILIYLQKQHLKIYEKVAQLNKFQRQNNEMLKNPKSTKFMEEKMLGFTSKEKQIFDPIITRAVRLIAEGTESKDNERLLQDYRENKLLTKIRALKREILQFYLGKEQKEKESFFFTLHQLKEYQNIEAMAKGMRFFNFKTMRELTTKLREMQESKKDWIEKERTKYQPLPCKLKL